MLFNLGLKVLLWLGLGGARARKLAMAAGWAVVLLVALPAAYGAFQLWDWLDDRGVRENANLERDVRDLENNAEANAEAGASKVERDRAEQAEQEELEDAVDEADADGRGAADDLWNGGLFD